MALVPAGIYRPLFRGPDDLKEIPVNAFLLDQAPVSNGEFLEFVRAHPKWQRSQVKRLFTDPTYLAHWAGDTDLGVNAETLAAQPVVNVSWFAAKSYADWRRKRLPTTAEWELAASAGYGRPVVRAGGAPPTNHRCRGSRQGHPRGARSGEMNLENRKAGREENGRCVQMSCPRVFLLSRFPNYPALCGARSVRVKLSG